MSMPTDSGGSGRSELRMMRAIVLALLWALLAGDCWSAEAASPWQGQVVAGDTKQPLEGVVVLAWWTRSVRSLGGFSEEYRDSRASWSRWGCSPASISGRNISNVSWCPM